MQNVWIDPSDRPALPDVFTEHPHIPLAALPTPLATLPGLTQHLGGPELIVKRDDMTGLATGGNKTRKLEFLLGHALHNDFDTLITAGGPQSNHCRQTAAAAAQAKLECHLVLGGEAPEKPLGNLLLDELLGAHLHWVASESRHARMQQLCEELQDQGRRPLVIPIGGSNAIGGLGYAAAMFELVQQLERAERTVDHIVFATSSGGTHAGMLAGAALAGFTGTLHGISIDQVPDAQVPNDQRDMRFAASVSKIASGTRELLRQPYHFSGDDVVMHYEYLGDGYGVMGSAERNAIHLLARTDGLLVGPVYTGRAMAGLIDLIERDVFSSKESVLFWHTGDDTTLHAYSDDFTTAT